MNNLLFYFRLKGSIQFFTTVLSPFSCEFSYELLSWDGFERSESSYLRSAQHFMPKPCSKQEFKELEYDNRIKVENVQTDGFFCFDKTALWDTIQKFKNDHHVVIMDEVAIFADNDIRLIKELSEKCESLWLAVTSIDPNLQKMIRSELMDFKILKDELNLPLRNTASINIEAYKNDTGI